MKACALTDTGRVRTANQDYVYASVEPVGSLPNLFVVADGMGGHQAGDYASRYIVENLVSYLQYTENSQIVEGETGTFRYGNDSGGCGGR